MSETTAPDAAAPTDPVGRVLDALCRLFAFLGGSVLVAITLMSVYSIVMRYFFGRPIAGDFELVQLGCAACVAAFLPISQLRGGNIIVDFFTTRVPKRINDRLDALGALLVAVVMGFLAWRTALGAMGVKSAGETSMIMGFPVWYSYALMVPGFALTTLVALHEAVRRFAGAGR
jgi:TRAP-type C4-dicarboxylate transport system permease small subunit